MKKIIVICVIALFIGVGVQPALAVEPKLSTDKFNDYNKTPLERGTLFKDDFNDNKKNHDKWIETQSGGEWEERNYQTEFKVREGEPSNDEAIESIPIHANISRNPGVEVLFWLHPKIGEYGYIYEGVNDVTIKDTDGNFIQIHHTIRSSGGPVRVKDSQGGNIRFIDVLNDRVQKFRIEIFSDRYRITEHSLWPTSTDWIYKSIFSGETNFTVSLHVGISGDDPAEWYKTSFDEVFVNTLTRYSNNEIYEKVEDCDCQTIVNDVDLNRIEKAINRIEGYTKLLSLYSKRNPEYKKIIEEINSRISNAKEKIQEIKYTPGQKFILCFITLMIYLPFWNLANMIGSIPTEPDTIFEDIIYFFTVLFFIPAFVAFLYGDLWECLWVEIFNPFEENSLRNPINNFIEITDF